MLIWCRVKFDELTYTFVIINTFIAVTLIIYGHYEFGLWYGFTNLLLFLLAIVWNS